MQNMQTNNKAVLIGKISSEFKFSHEVYNEKFYSFMLAIPRLSGNSDNIIITASEQLIFSKGFKIGDDTYVTGQFRSYNNYSDTGNKLILTVFAKDIEYADIDRDDNNCYINEVMLIGYICKPSIFRTTPFGREITDMLVAVNRTYNKSDYIPCILWGRNAKYASSLVVGEKIKIIGRIQSREYQKKISDNEFITKTAYEVSVSKITIDDI